MIISPPQSLIGFFTQRIHSTVFLFFFCFVFVLNAQFIDMPPVWDAVPGVFAPAIYLYETNFDFTNLLKQDGFFTGGPNNHSFSLITFLTYFFIVVSKGNPNVFLPILHFANFVCAAITLTCTYSIARRIFGAYIAVGLTFSLLFFPLFLIQTGYVYTEIPGAALSSSALFAWGIRKYRLAIWLAVLACMIKSFGIAVIFTLFLLFLLDTSVPYRQKITWIACMTLPVLLLELIKWEMAISAAQSQANYLFHLKSIIAYLSLTPDLKFLIIASCIYPLSFVILKRTYTPRSIIKSLSSLVSSDASHRLIVVSFIFPSAFIGFIVTAPIAGKDLFPLLRYYVWCLPFVFIASCYACKLFLDIIIKYHITSRTNKTNITLIILLLSLTGFFILNREGRFYPHLGASIYSFSAVERSYEYLSFFRIQRDSVVALTEKQKNIPAFVTRGEYCFLSSPLMGYVDKKMKNIFLVVKEPYSNANLGDYPNEFLLLDAPTNPFHGRTVVKKILANTKNHTAYSVSELAKQRVGPYFSTIYRVKRTSRP